MFIGKQLEKQSFYVDIFHVSGRFCWSILQTNEHTLKAFLERRERLTSASCRRF